MASHDWVYRRFVRSALASVAAFVFLSQSSAARADETIPVDRGSETATSSEVHGGAGLGVYLRASAQQAHAARRSVVLTGVVAGATMVPVGVALAQRSDPVSQSIGLGMAIGGAAPLFFSALSLAPTKIERLEAEYEGRVASGAQGGDLDRSTETEWAELAKAGHDVRIVRGVVELALGVAATAVGVALLLASPVEGLSRNQQYTVGSVCAGAGVPILSLGIRAMLQQSPEESWWAAYSAAGDSSPSARHDAGRPLPSVQIVPLRDGVLAAMTISR